MVHDGPVGLHINGMIDQGDTTVKERPEIHSAEGRLGVLLPGMGRRRDDDHLPASCSRGGGSQRPSGVSLR